MMNGKRIMPSLRAPGVWRVAIFRFVVTVNRGRTATANGKQEDCHVVAALLLAMTSYLSRTWLFAGEK